MLTDGCVSGSKCGFSCLYERCVNANAKPGNGIEESLHRKLEGVGTSVGRQLEMAHPACNFIRHTLTIFLPLLFRARMPKRGDSCKRKVAGAGLDLHRNKFIFAQIVIPLFFHAVMNIHSFLDGHQLHPRCPALRPSPYSPLASRSSFILLTLHN